MTVLLVEVLPAAVNLKFYAGDDFYLDVTVNNPDGTAADLTGRTVTAQIRAAAGAATVTGNIIHLHLANADSAKLDGGYRWDCQSANADGSDKTTLAAGN